MLRWALEAFGDTTSLEALDLLPTTDIQINVLIFTDDKAIVFIVIIIKYLQGQ